MTQPAAPATDPTGATVTLPPAPAPTPQTVPVPADLLKDPAVQAAIETARKQEKEKLYPELQTLREQQEQAAAQLAALTADREERERREQEAIQAAAAAAEEKRRAELSFAEQLSEFQNQTSQQLTGLQQQLAERDAVLAKERQFNELMNYRNAALTGEDETGPGRGLGPRIMPELRDFVTGNTVEEIEASISALAERSASILQNVVSATGDAVQQARQSARGVGVTAPPVGPMDNNSGHQTVTAEDIRDMDMATYAANRGRLLGAASQNQRDKGMFG